MSKKKDTAAADALPVEEGATSQESAVAPPGADAALAAGEDQAAPPSVQGSAPAAHVFARVLVLCDLGRPDDVVEVGESELTGLTGIVDADPDAVAYAQSLKY